MKYTVKPSSRFKKDLKIAQKRGYDIDILTEVIKKLASGEKMPEKNKDHQLSGKLAQYRECHITPDWLLVYKYIENELVLFLVQTGSRSEVLDM